MPKVEGIYNGSKLIGWELLCNSFNLPLQYRERIFQAIPEDFDLECFFSHLGFAKRNRLGGFIFVNLKPQTFVKYHEKILSAIDRKVVIELREDWLSPDDLRTLYSIRKNHFFLLSIDDFGIGSSNLDRVGVLYPNFIKIDMRVFRKNGRVAVRELVNFVNFLKDYTSAVLVAEKVESYLEWKASRSAGLRIWSGWYEKKLVVKK